MPLADAITARLELSRWNPGVHTPALEGINALSEAVRHLNAGVPYTAQETSVQSERFAAHWDRYGFGLWAVTVRDSGVTIGFVGLSHPLWFPALEHEVEVGWRLHPDAWGHGYATEAGRAAISAAAELGLERLIAVIAPGNAPSIAVANRLELAHERTLAHPQRPGDVFIYARAV